LKKQLKNRKESRHYICNTCSIEVNEETALLNNFICPECDEVYVLSDDSEVIEEIERKILKLKKESKLVLEEKEIEEVKIEIAKKRKIKKAEAERKAKRALTAKKKQDSLKRKLRSLRIKQLIKLRNQKRKLRKNQLRKKLKRKNKTEKWRKGKING